MEAAVNKGLYKKYKLAAGKTAKSILISCGARLAPFDIRELRELMPATTLERIKGMVKLRDCVNRLITSQLDDFSNEEVRIYQGELNTLYDDFTQKYGLINSTANSRAFSEDSAYYLLCALEELDENGSLVRLENMSALRSSELFT